jgi:hypothetical protein
MADLQGVPDIYTDLVNVQLSEMGTILAFRATMPPLDMPTGLEPGTVHGPTLVPTELRAIIRMSHVHTKILAIQLRKVLKSYEEAMGVI